MRHCCDETINADDRLIKSCRKGRWIKIRKPNPPIHNAKISGGRRFEPREPNMCFRPLDLDVSQAYRFQFLVSKVIKKESVARLRSMKSASD